MRLQCVYSYVPHCCLPLNTLSENVAKRELQNTLTRADKFKGKADLSSVSTGGSLISAESIKAGKNFTFRFWGSAFKLGSYTTSW